MKVLLLLAYMDGFGSGNSSASQADTNGTSLMRTCLNEIAYLCATTLKAYYAKALGCEGCTLKCKRLNMK